MIVVSPTLHAFVVAAAAAENDEHDVDVGGPVRQIAAAQPLSCAHGAHDASFSTALTNPCDPDSFHIDRASRHTRDSS